MSTENQQQESMFIQSQMSEPHSPLGVFELPCGYLTADGSLLTEVKVKEITGADEDMLNSRNITPAKKVTHLIGSCLVSIGAITEKAELVRIARDLVMGDRVFLMFASRRITLGDLYPFEDECPACEKKSLFSVNLSSLDIKKMPDPRKRVFDTKLPSGISARYHVMTGKDEESIAKASQSADQASLGILVRLDSIGEKPVDMNRIKALSMRDRNFLRDLFNEVEGGVETTIELECPKCGEEFETELNMGQTGFFFPTRTQKNSKLNSSS
jgi:hypothetical protein